MRERPPCRDAGGHWAASATASASLPRRARARAGLSSVSTAARSLAARILALTSIHASTKKMAWFYSDVRRGCSRGHDHVFSRNKGDNDDGGDEGAAVTTGMATTRPRSGVAGHKRPRHGHTQVRDCAHGAPVGVPQWAASRWLRRRKPPKCRCATAGPSRRPTAPWCHWAETPKNGRPSGLRLARVPGPGRTVSRVTLPERRPGRRLVCTPRRLRIPVSAFPRGIGQQPAHWAGRLTRQRALEGGRSLRGPP